MHHTFLIHSFTDGYLGCFQHLGIENSAAMNIGVHRFFWIGVSGSLGYNPSSGHCFISTSTTQVWFLNSYMKKVAQCQQERNHSGQEHWHATLPSSAHTSCMILVKLLNFLRVIIEKTLIVIVSYSSHYVLEKIHLECLVLFLEYTLATTILNKEKAHQRLTVSGTTADHMWLDVDCI